MIAKLQPLPLQQLTGVIESIDIINREILLLVDQQAIRCDVPVDCPVFLHSERVKLRLLQKHDQVDVLLAHSYPSPVARRIEVRRCRDSASG
jgi:hypothetical protein